jgi:hypothetical protein
LSTSQLLRGELTQPAASTAACPAPPLDAEAQKHDPVVDVGDVGPLLREGHLQLAVADSTSRPATHTAGIGVRPVEAGETVAAAAGWCSGRNVPTSLDRATAQAA